jgi:hypothetical protein
LPTPQQELWLKAALLPGEAGLAAWRRDNLPLNKPSGKTGGASKG